MVSGQKVSCTDPRNEALMDKQKASYLLKRTGKKEVPLYSVSKAFQIKDLTGAKTSIEKTHFKAVKEIWKR